MSATLQIVNIRDSSLIKRYEVWYHMPQAGMELCIDSLDYKVIRILISGKDLESMFVYVEPAE